MNYNIAKCNTLFMRGESERAADGYYELAREGNAEAAFNYAHCLWHGIGCARDAARAGSFFSYAMESDDGEAHYNLAMLYMHGDGVARDYHRSFSHMSAAAEQGCVEAMLYLGMAYTLGYIMEPDVVAISKIPFHTPIYRATGLACLTGDVPDAEQDEEARFSVVQPDDRTAFLWFRAAARSDPTYVSELVAEGKFLYAKCYVDGFGTPHDPERGIRLLLAAGRDGSRSASDYLISIGISPNAQIGRPRKDRGGEDA